MIETPNHNTRLHETNKNLNLKQTELKSQIQSARLSKKSSHEITSRLS